MEEHLTAEPEPTQPASRRRKMSGKERGFLFGALGLVALLAVGGATFAIPRVIHANQVSEYTQTLAQTNEAITQAASDKASEAAAIELAQLQEDGVREYAKQLTALGTTAAPILTADVTAAIKKSAESLTKELGEPVKPEVESAKLPLSVAYKERIASDKEVADKAVTQIAEQQKKDLEKAKDDAAKTKINDAATEATEEARSQQITGNVLDLTVEQSVELLKLDTSVTKITPVPDAQVNGDVLDQAKKDRDNAAAAANKQSKALASVQKQIDAIHSKLGETTQVLLAAGNEAPAQVKEVIAAAPKSTADSQTNATDKALAAQDAITGNAEKREAGDKKSEDKAKAEADTKSDKSGEEPATVEVTLKSTDTPATILSLVTGYVTAAKAVTDSHAAVVAAEAAAAAAAAAAEAAASGASGYTDPSTGGWVDTGWSGGGNDGGWSGGGGNSGSGGGSNNGGGGGNSGGGGGNAGTPESWFAANCPHGYNWWWSPGAGGQGYCYDAPDIDDGW